MFKLRPQKDGAKEIPGISVKDIALFKVKFSATNPLYLTKELRKRFGEIYKVEVFNDGLIFLASQRMAAPVLSMPDCVKVTHAFLAELRSGKGQDGLFTMYNEEPQWAAAHRLLVPAFGAMSIRSMYDQMNDILTSMLVRWSAHEDTIVNLPDQLTRLTLDTIALCSFDYRFNSFYKDEMHPFVNDMLEFLRSSASRGLNPVLKPFRVDLKVKRKAARDRMGRFADRIIKERKNGSSQANDLCARMLNLADPETGEKLSDKHINAELLTFLVAGHETTSGMLSFCLYFMMKNLETMRKAQEEVDAIEQITRDSLTKLPYIEACLKEALRLEPTAPMFGVCSQQEVELADGFVLPAGQEVMIDLHGLHRDPLIYPDPEAYKPERMLDFDALPPHSWKPFGNGVRSCIGRAFAMQESILAIAGIVKNFDLQLADPNYKFKTKFTLTIKPDNLMVRVKRRRAIISLPLASHLKPPGVKEEKMTTAKSGAALPMTILYGSEAGSCHLLAKEVQAEATTRGFVASVNSMNSCTELPTDQPVVIITASYDGRPPSNAKQFVKSLQDGQALSGVRYCVLGMGHSEWKMTFQAVPILVDELMEKNGGTRIIERGLGDVAGNFVLQFEEWKTQLFSVLKTNSAEVVETSNIEILPRKAAHEEASLAKVVSSIKLADKTEKGKEKRRLDIELSGSYEPGDYIDVFPVNSTESVLSILKYFNLDEDTSIAIDGSPVRAFDHLRHKVDFSKPVPRYMISKLASSCPCPNSQAMLSSYAEPELYNSEVLTPGLTLFDTLKRFKCTLKFEHFLDALEPMRSRCYSISSSPKTPTITVTYDVSGLTTKHMQQLRPGDELICSLRPSRFHLPTDDVPVLCFAAGTGIAPFRGFAQHGANMVLYYGSRTTEDSLYASEMPDYKVDFRPSYSSVDGYVCHRVAKELDFVLQNVQAGAIMYVCGSVAFATSLRDLWSSLPSKYEEITKATNSERYRVDVFS